MNNFAETIAKREQGVYEPCCGRGAPANFWRCLARGAPHSTQNWLLKKNVGLIPRWTISWLVFEKFIGSIRWTIPSPPAGASFLFSYFYTLQRRCQRGLSCNSNEIYTGKYLGRGALRRSEILPHKEKKTCYAYLQPLSLHASAFSFIIAAMRLPRRRRRQHPQLEAKLLRPRPRQRYRSTPPEHS